MRIIVLAAIATAAVVVTAPRPAEACSCDNVLRVTPADGAEDVPVNVEIVVDSGPNGSPAGGPPPYVLTGPDGPVAVAVERVVEQWAYSIDLVRPVEPLAPMADYVLTDGDARLWPDVEVSFRTGSEADTTTPAAVETGELVLAYAKAQDAFGCGDEYYFVDFPLTAPDDAVAIDLLVDGDHYVITAEKLPWGLTNWNSSCGITIPLDPGLEYCFEARARDLAGNLGEPVQRCATVTACPDIDALNGDDWPDLTDCNDPDPEPRPESSGCSTTAGSTLPLPLAAVFLLTRRRWSRRRRLALLAAIATAAVVVTAPRPAEACSCAFDALVAPGDGETDVPTNVVLLVRNRSTSVGDEVVVLEGPDGEVAIEVVVVIEQAAHRLELVRPLAPLEPLSEYTLRAGWLDATFTTAAGADIVAPEPVVLGELTLARADASGEISFSCGDEYAFVDLEVTPPPDAVAIDLFVTDRDHRAHYVIDAERFGWGLSSWNEGCEMRITLEPDQATCFEVRARDQAGNLSDPVERCAIVTACADIPDPEAFDGDLSDCQPHAEPPEPPPEASGCSTTSATGIALPLAAMVLLGGWRRSRR